MILDGQPGKMCRRHRLSEDSAREGSSQRCMEIKHSLRQSLEILERARVPGSWNTAGEESEKTQGQRSMEGRGVPLGCHCVILASTVNDT